MPESDEHPRHRLFVCRKPGSIDMSSSTSSDSARAERRKLRRGTTSCWECKRRKQRCHFERSGSGVCESCERRGCKCVPQHIQERSSVTEAADHSVRARYAGDQLDHLEGLVDGLVRQSTLPASSICDPDHLLQNPNRNILREKQNSPAIKQTSQRTRAPQPSSDSRRRLLPKPHLGLNQSSCNSSTDDNLAPFNQPAQTSIPPLSSQFEGADALLLPPHPTNGALRCSSLTLLLQSILPSANVTTRIMHQNKLLMMSMHVFRGLSTDPFRSSAPRQISLLASPTSTNSEPIDLARRLFQLAICLQQSERTSEISTLCLDRSNNDVAGQYFEAASRYVTSQDSLVVSFVGIETLMLEGLYHVSTGQIRLAWLVFRRAIGIAHLMGLHIPQRRRHSKQTPICLATLWFRLIFTERYLSLVLCLPISVQDDSFMEDLIGQEPHEQLERIQAKLTSRIISRNELMRLDPCASDTTYDHYNATKDIDYTLKQAARALPADWWAFPRLKDAQTNADLRDMTAKVVLQLHHYNLVLLLHLPYIVPRLGNCSTGQGAQDYTKSKLSAMFASRELLIRCIIPVSPNRVTSSTRGNTVKIILSALALLLAHLDSYRLGRDNALDHQRPGDLLRVERAIQSLESVAQKYDDKLCSSAVRALRRLGNLEAAASDGLDCRVWSEPSEMLHLECLVRDDEGTVTLEFPYVGTIHIMRRCRREDVLTDGIGSQSTTETAGLNGDLLTSPWAWRSPSSSLWPDLVSTALRPDGPQPAISNGPDVQDSRNLLGSDVECIDMRTMPRLHLHDLHVSDGI